ncbi:MAG TPA: hypothetical protein VGM33_19040 [Baekduia sp.]|jgi:hypothetical protein
MPQALRHLRRNAVAYLALFVALGGTSYAATALPRNSVGASQLKAGAVTSAKVKNHSLVVADLSVGTVAALRGSAGAAGVAGVAGAPGAAGATGARGAAGPQGATGPTGATGAQGLQGDPGIVATGWSALTSSTLTLIAHQDQVMTDLGLTSSGSGSGAVTLPVSSRVLISGSVDLYNRSPGDSGRAACTARRSTDGTDDLSLFTVSPTVNADLHQSDAGSSTDANVTESLSITGSVLLPAGTYDFGIDCEQTAGNGVLVLYSAAMNVLAVPAES